MRKARNRSFLDKNNHLNLPTQVLISNPEHIGNISYIYDASGVKLKKITTEGSSLITTEYAGNYVYENGTLQFFSTAEGYTEPATAGAFKYVYQYKDHLGNIRLSYKDISTTSTPNLQILEKNNYYLSIWLETQRLQQHPKRQRPQVWLQRQRRTE